jgi:serine O-acetyltransferase
VLAFHGTPEGASTRQNIDQPMVFKRLNEDLDAFMARDPAARSRLEVALCYSGLHAILIHRFARRLWQNGFPLLSRIISQFGRWVTGIEIHPGATIGRRFVIDHGQGIVIGETAEIGDDVTLYQGVTLGGIAPAVDSRAQVSVKRHPTLRDGVIVGSGAQILGAIVVGERARVGANSVVTRDVPPGITAVGIPAHEVRPRERGSEARFSAYGTPAEGCPDPFSAELDELRAQVASLVSVVATIERRLQAAGTGEGDKGDGQDDTTTGMRRPVADHDAAHW